MHLFSWLAASPWLRAKCKPRTAAIVLGICSLLLSGAALLNALVLTEASQLQVKRATVAQNCCPPDTELCDCVCINFADFEQLVAIPGIGPGRAVAILQYRKQNGPFENLQQLQRHIDGISKRLSVQLEPIICF